MQRFYGLLHVMRGLFMAVLFFVLIAADGIAQKAECRVSQQQIPVLTNRRQNSIIDIKIKSQGTFSLSELEIGFKGTSSLGDIKRIYILEQKNKEWQIVAMMDDIKKKIRLSLPTQSKDSLLLKVACDILEDADLTHFVDMQCNEIVVDGVSYRPKDESGVVQRLGVSVRNSGDNDVNTYRIPGLATTNDGTLLAIYDMRYENSRDLQGHVDIGVSRSVDGGRTWELPRVALDMKQWGRLPEKFNGVSDASILVDRKSNKIFIAGLWMHGLLDKEGKWIEGLDENSKQWTHQWLGRASQPGYDVKQTCQFLITESSDDGRTWSEPLNITKCKKQEWWLFAPAPGNGITLADGTLVFPTQGRDSTGIPFSNITYSKDGGKTWTTSEPAYSNTTECAVVELGNGELMLNMRDNRNGKEKGKANGRAVFTTVNLGQTWKEHPTSHGALIEPVCMGSLYKYNYVKSGRKQSVLLFSNPDSKFHRNRLSIKISKDNGATWQDRCILLDEGYGYGYSCLTSLPDGSVGILYEGSKAQMTFQRIKPDEILK